MLVDLVGGKMSESTHLGGMYGHGVQDEGLKYF